MKHTILITILAFSFLTCKAQSPIISIDSLGIHNIENAYYKDLNNDLNPFEGTWLYTNGNTSLKIILEKKIMFNNGDYYEDLMVGGYQYIENGVEKINTLSDVNHPSLGYHASIKGNTILDSCYYLPTDDCVESEKRLSLSIEDTFTNDHYGSLILHKRTINGQEALNVRIEFRYYKATVTEDEIIPDPTMPWQMNNIIMIKQ